MLSMYLLTYIVVFVMCEGGDWATTRRMSCLHKGAWVPGVRYLSRCPHPEYRVHAILASSVTIGVRVYPDWLLTGYDYSTKVCHALLVINFWYQSASVSLVRYNDSFLGSLY